MFLYQWKQGCVNPIYQGVKENKSNKEENSKQAGAELGQAQLKLELELCWYLMDS